MDILFILGSLSVLSALFMKRKTFMILVAVGCYLLYFNGGLSAIVNYTWYMNGTRWLLFMSFLLGMLLLVAEVYLPSFGLLTIFGTGLTLWSLYQREGNMVSVILLIISTALILGFMTYYLYQQGHRWQFSRKLVLNEASKNTRSEETITHPTPLQGQVTSDLRPVGKGVVDGKLVVMSSVSDFIPCGTPVIVKFIKNKTYYVEKL